MIARIWHGVTDIAHADEYLNRTRNVGLPDYRSVPGNISAYALRRVEGDRAHFLTLTFWESRDAIVRFAGQDIERAKYYDFDKDFLLKLEPTVRHYEIFDR
ncbi:MAG TPA: antibiotic biosynthesis monooxygenase [Candidatus Acidoferrum sp.]|nr:antibiotic biosynthesis monooxygenase [Candidatus Acidoferrum sp.]